MEILRAIFVITLLLLESTNAQTIISPNLSIAGQVHQVEIICSNKVSIPPFPIYDATITVQRKLSTIGWNKTFSYSVKGFSTNINWTIFTHEVLTLQMAMQKWITTNWVFRNGINVKCVITNAPTSPTQISFDRLIWARSQVPSFTIAGITNTIFPGQHIYTTNNLNNKIKR